MEFLSFDEAREYVHKLGFNSSQEWNKYCSSGKKPHNIPRAVWRTYRKQWKGWGDWLGTGRTRDFRSFEAAREFVHKLGLKSSKEWREFCKSRRPMDIPTSPEKSYSREWVNWGDWLGTANVSSRNRKYRTFDEARKYVRSLGLSTIEDWKEFCKSQKRPLDIPTKPYIVYKKNWKKWFDWLGSTPLKGRRYKSFADAKKFVHNLGLRSQSEWRNYCASGKTDIPSNPQQVYSDDWMSWGDWLGTGTVADQYREYRPFGAAREFVRKLGLKNVEDWKKYCRSKRKPEDIPTKPYRSYKKEWISFGD